MVSRYGVSKEGAVGVAVGVGPMHCLLPHCGGPHHHHHLSAPHPQNPQAGHNHHVHPAHQPPPSPSPHLNHQLSHHQLTVNINHLSHQQQQQQQQQQQNQHQQAPPQYRVVTANVRSEFHVSGQNYGTQPGGQVGGGGGSVGVPGGRGPPPLGGLQSIGQSGVGIPPGGPAGGQAPPQTPAPGVQSQQPQGPAPTTTPPVHTPSPQEMGKQAHLQPQPQPLSQVYGSTQTRPTTQGYYQQGPRPQQPRGLSHRGGQGGTGAQIVGMSGVAGGGGQPTAIYHPGGLPVQTGTMYPVPNIHSGPHQQSVYPMSSQIPLQFGGPSQRHQTHQNQPYFAPFQHSTLLTTQNMFGYGAPTPTPQPYFWPTGQPANTPISLSRAGANAVTGGAQHVAGPLAGAQGAPVVPQGTLQQSTQQAQPLPSMGISLSQTDVYSGHNGGATSTTNSTIKSRKPRGQNAITDIVDPSTGKNISHEIYKDNETIQSGDSSNRDTPQPQNNNAEVQADFAARVAKTLVKVGTEESSSDSTVPTSVPNTPATQNVTQSLSNSQTNSNNDVNSQCSTSSPTQNTPNVIALCSQSLGTPSNMAQVVDFSAVKTESKPLQIPVKEFQPRGEIKSVVIEEPPPAAPRNVNKDDVSAQLSAMTVTEVEVKSTSTSASPTVTQVPIPLVTAPSTNVPEVPKPSTTAPSANPAPAREPLPTLSSKNSSSSPPRRKSQTHAHNQPAAAAAAAAVATELHSSAKEQKEKKTREKSLNSRGATPTPAHNQSDHHPKANGDATSDKPESEPARNEVQQQKTSDGKAMQKQKSKNKLKPRDLNRKGAEKEGTDMDAFVNTVPPVKTETKQDNKDPPAPKDSNKEASRDITKDIKEKDNYESKKEKEVTSVHPKTEKHVAPLTPEIPQENTVTQTTVIENLSSNKETLKEPSPKIEDNNKTNLCNAQAKSVPNDVVDHVQARDETDLEAIVAQKNEENSKVSAIRTPNEEKQPVAHPVIEKSNEAEPPAQTETPVTNQITLKYKYNDDQWSPLNKSGKKIYDREFLINLKNDPNSKIKPSNLPDLDVVLKDSSKARTTIDMRQFKDSNMNRHDMLFPGFIKPNLNPRVLPTSRTKSNSGRSSKPTKPNVIHLSLSLREDVKLREAENAWKPTRLKKTNLSEEETKSEALYKRVRSVLNKLTPEKFYTLVDQVRALPIDTPERLQGVINLVFEKAVDEPSFSVAYALMCKELAMMEVSGSEKESDQQEFIFRKLIVTRCQNEFEKNSVNEEARISKLKEIEECTDPDKKKILQLELEEEERRIRIKSVGNIRFIGELYKQGMLTTMIMRRCVKQLLDQGDEDSLECLCKLLTTIGKDLEMKGPVEEMQDYFNKMQDIISRRAQGKISSRIRFMLQDVIDLRANRWVSRRSDSTPKTIDQIQKEAESERVLDSQMSNTPLNTPRKDERTSDRKRNRGVGPTDDAGWSQPVVRTRQPYSVETAKLKHKPPPMDDMQLGSRNTYMWKPLNSGSKAMSSSNKFACLGNVTSLDQDKRVMSPQLFGSRSTGPREYGRDYKSSYDGRGSRNGSHQLSSSSSSRESSSIDNTQSQSVSLPPTLKSSQSTPSSHSKPLTKEEFKQAFDKILIEYLKNTDIEKAASAIQQNFEKTLPKFVLELVNYGFEKSPTDRMYVSQLISHLISQNIMSLQQFRSGFIDILDDVDDLQLDIPKLWLYLVEILSHPLETEVIPLSELKPVFDSLRARGYIAKFLEQLLPKLSRDKGSKWIAEKWDQSGLQLNTVNDPKLEDAKKIIEDHKLEFCTGDYNSAKSSTNNQLTLQHIQTELKRLMEESNFDVICDWIIANVGNRVKEPEFIRVLTTAILETSMKSGNNKWHLKTEILTNLQQLIRRFVDANESLELQCLYAIQLHLQKLQYPPGILFEIMTSLSDYNIISSDAFLTWKDSPEPAQREWHGVATMALTSFFTGLQEVDDASSVEDVSTDVNQDRC